MDTRASPPAIDLAQRPRSYFWPLALATQLLTHVKGAARRAALQKLIDEDRLDELPEYLARARLSDTERSLLGRIHPQLMGGEYLPDQHDGEVEIARIEIDSTTADVTSVYARRDGGLIRYRVVDEYEGETLGAERERTSIEPLTLEELYDFFTGAWSLQDVLEMNGFADAHEALAFFRGCSAFYPQFDALLRERVTEVYSESADEDR